MKEGWGDMNGYKWHYYRDGVSLCGKWRVFGKILPLLDDDPKDRNVWSDCPACVRKLEE